MYTGELLSLVVAVSWTFAAMSADIASRYATVTVVNAVRMWIAVPMFLLLLFFTTGSFLPMHADAATWGWLSLAGLVGYIFGDICLFRSYQEMGARYGQLFMTLAPLFSAIFGWMLLGETLPARTWLAIFIVLAGIAASVLSKAGGSHLHMKVSAKAAWFGVGAALGQGLGLVISKIGMLTYESALPAGVSPDTVMMPFAATFIRCITALVGFQIILFAKHEAKGVGAFVRKGKAMTALTLATIFGPFVGVSLSLLAVTMTSAGIAATLMALVPIFILLPSWLFMHQRITWLDLAGTTLAVAGVAILFL